MMNVVYAAITAAVFALSLCCPLVWAQPQQNSPDLPPAGRVFDGTGVLSDEDHDELSLLLQAFSDTLGCELAVVFVETVEDQEAALALSRSVHDGLIAAEILPARKSGVLLYAGPGTLRAYSRKSDVDEALKWDFVVAGWREAAEAPWPRKVIVQLQAMLRLALGDDPAQPTPPAPPTAPPLTPPTTAPTPVEPGAPIPHPAGQKAGNLEAVAELVETALRQADLATLLGLSVQSLHQELELALGQSPENMRRLADLLATRRLLNRDATGAEFEITVDDLRLTIRFIQAENEWLLLSL